MDLFTPVVPPERFHPNFATALHVLNPHTKAVLDKWAEGFGDRDGDGKFVAEFQKTFNGGFWELYLHAVLKEIGCQIDFSHPSPDFVVTGPVPFVLEATVALNASSVLPEWTPRDAADLPKDLNEFNRSAMVRLLNSISDKTRKYRKLYQHLPHVQGKPFVLAIAPFEQRFSYLQAQRAIEAVLHGYYVDEEEYLNDPARFDSITAQKLTKVRKNEAVELDLGIFNDASHAHISAVAFNSLATMGKVRVLSDDPNPTIRVTASRSNPITGEELVFDGFKDDYEETLFDGLRVYHNPHAAHPLDMRVFQELGATQAMCVDPDEFKWNLWMYSVPLSSRYVTSCNLPPGVDVAELRRRTEGRKRSTWRKVEFTPDVIAEIAARAKARRAEGHDTQSPPGA